MAEEGNPDRIKAREYLLIPLSKKVYIIMPDGTGTRNLISACGRIIAKETGDFVIYVFCSRESGLCDLLPETFGEGSPVKPVVVGNRVEMYLKAADVIFSKVSLSGDPEGPFGKASPSLKVAFSRTYRSMTTAAAAARRFLEKRQKH